MEGEWLGLLCIAIPLAFVGYLIYRGLPKADIDQHKQPRPSLHERPPSLAPEEPYRRVLEIRVPAGMKWEPERAQGLMAQFFTFRVPFNLVIRTSRAGTVWQIEAGADKERLFTAAVYARYPGAEVVARPKTIDFGYAVSEFEAPLPFQLPAKFAKDFQKDASPMAMTSSIFTDLLQDKQEIVYEIALRPPTRHYQKIAHQLLYWNSGDPVWVPEVQKPAEEKLAQPLAEAKLFLKWQGSDAGWIKASLVRFYEGVVAQISRKGISPLALASDATYPLVLCPQEVAALWHLPTADCTASGIAWAAGTAAPLPATLRLAPVTEGVVLGANTYQGEQQEVRLAYADRVTHVNIIGRTRVGKSTLMHNLIAQDIAGGEGVGVIDPHGDLVNAILASSIPQHREEDVVLFDVTDTDYPIGLNLLAVPEGVSPEVAAGQALAVVRKMFADEWHSGRMENVLHACLASLVAYPGATIQDVTRLPINNEFRAQVLPYVTDVTALEYWYDIHEGLSPRQQLEIAQPIINRIQRFYRDPTIRRIICQTSSLDFRRIIDSGQIFLANLGGLTEIEAETLGALLVSKIQMAAMSRANVSPAHRQPFYLHVDEVQKFVTTSLPAVLSEAAKYGLSLTVANQYLSQLSGDTLSAVMGNVGTTIMFRCGPDDARVLGRFVGPHFNAEDLGNLDRYVAVVKMQHAGETLPAFSLTTPRPPERLEHARELAQRIRTASRTAYARPRAEVDEELAGRYKTPPRTPTEERKPDDAVGRDDLDDESFLG